MASGFPGRGQQELIPFELLSNSGAGQRRAQALLCRSDACAGTSRDFTLTGPGPIRVFVHLATPAILILNLKLTDPKAPVKPNYFRLPVRQWIVYPLEGPSQRHRCTKEA